MAISPLIRKPEGSASTAFPQGNAACRNRKPFGEPEPSPLPDIFRYTLSEPNICVLDMAAVTGKTGLSLPPWKCSKPTAPSGTISGRPTAAEKCSSPGIR